MYVLDELKNTELQDLLRLEGEVEGEQKAMAMDIH